MTFVEIALRHPNTNWKFDIGINPVSFDPRFWDSITTLMDNMICKMWDCCSLRSEKCMMLNLEGSNA